MTVENDPRKSRTPPALWRLLLFLAAAAVIAAVIAFASTCKPGDRGVTIGGWNVSGCPVERGPK
jgi:hypothetical protein